METILDEIETPSNTDIKIYKDKAIYLAGYLGGPLAAGYIIAMNFKAFGETNKYKGALLITVLMTVAIFTLVFSIPDDVHISNHIIPITYTIIAFFIIRWTQGKQIDAHVRSGGAVYSWGRVLLVSLIGIVITVLALAPYIYYITVNG